MKNLIFPAIAMFAALPSVALETVCGPDGRLCVEVDCSDGKPVYSVTYDNVPFLMTSPLGLNTDIGDYRSGLELLRVSPVEEVAENYAVPTIKKSKVDYNARRRVFTFGQNGKAVMDVVFEVAPNDIAFRYKVLPQGEKLSAVVLDEATGFVLPSGSTTFLCPQSEPMKGWKGTYPSYETEYAFDDEPGKNGEGYGYTFPCLFRNGDKGWTLVSETGVDGLYCGSRLEGGDGYAYKIAYPLATEMNGLGWVTPGIGLPGYTPWRTITVGNGLAPIVETTAPFNTVEQLYDPGMDIGGSRGLWSWIIGQDESVNYQEQLRYIDAAAEMGYETILVDGLWDKQIGRENMEKIAAYAASKGVSLYVWYNSNGYWNDAPQGPRNIMNNSIARKKEMKWLRDLGVKGIKVDFFGGDKQPMMQLYQDILSDANDYGIRVIFHGCTLPRGWERMFPNYAASEAVLASENLNFRQDMCDAEAKNASIHTFVRNTVGAMDFGGSTLNRYYNAADKPGARERRTSDVFALATAVLFQSPVQHFAFSPTNITSAPEWAVEFMKSVPTEWDDVRFIDGYPGRYVIMARRAGDKWYVAGINAMEKAVETELDLSPFFPAGAEVSVYSDNKKLEGSLASKKTGKKSTLKVSIPTNGAVLIVG